MTPLLPRSLRDRLTGGGESSRQLRRLAGNSGLLLGSRLGSIPLSLAQSVLAARLLGVEGFGLLAVAVAFVAVLNQLTSFRMNEFVVRFGSQALAEDDRERAAATVKAALAVEAGASIASFLAILVAAGPAARWFAGGAEAAAPIRLYAFLVLGNLVFETSNGILQLNGRFRPQALAALAIRALTLAGTFVAFLAGAGLSAVLLSMVVGNALPGWALAAVAWRDVGTRLGPGWWRVPWKALGERRREMRSFVLSTNVSTSLSLVVKDGDALWIGLFCAPAEVGYYRLATTLVKFVLLAGNPLAQAAYPEIARALADRRPERAVSLIRQGTWLSVAWIVPLGLVLAAAGPWLLATFYGREFLPAYPSLLLLLAGMGLAQILFWTRPTLLALGRHRFALLVAAGNAALKVPATLLAVPRFGQVGMAAVTSALFVLGSVVSAAAVRLGISSRSTTTSEAADLP